MAEPIGWFTANGQRIPIMEGETTDQALKRFTMEKRDEAIKRPQSNFTPQGIKKVLKDAGLELDQAKYVGHAEKGSRITSGYDKVKTGLSVKQELKDKNGNVTSYEVINHGGKKEDLIKAKEAVISAGFTVSREGPISFSISRPDQQKTNISDTFNRAVNNHSLRRRTRR